MRKILSKKNFSIGLSTTIYSALTLSTQILALLSLSTILFGSFSIIYLVYAFATSLMLSLASEPLVRSRTITVDPTTTRGYLSTVVLLSICAGVAVLGIGLVIELPPLIAFASSVAVAVNAIRGGIRYLQMHLRQWQEVLRSDIYAVFGFIVAFITLWLTDANAILVVVGTWMLAGTVSIIPSIFSFRFSLNSVINWFSIHRTDIKYLLRDSLLMDIGAIFTPLLLSTSLGLSAFGTYRAISNVAAPVRLLLNPLRPLIGASTRNVRHSAMKVVLIANLIGAIFGILASLTLWFMELLELKFGVISSLYDFLIPVGIFVAASFTGHFFYIKCRFIAEGRQLLIGRIFQTVVVVVGPILGVMLWGLNGAIWLLSFSTMLSAGVWGVICFRKTITGPDQISCDGSKQ